MNVNRYLLIFFFTCTLLSCDQELSDVEFEKDVLNQVFVEIVDSIYIDRRINIPPAPNLTEKQLQRFKVYNDSIKNDPAKLTIAVDEYINEISSKDEDYIAKTLKDLEFNYNETKNINRYKFNFAGFKNNPKFKFEPLSNYPKSEYWKHDDFSLPINIITVSRIHFNYNKTLGILVASSDSGGGKSGRGFVIVLKNAKNGWKISKIIQIWVS